MIRTLLAPVFFLLLGLLMWLERLPPEVAALYLLLSIATFALYARDKRAARRQQARTPENTLHLLAGLGGWPGALLAQNTLRHKSSKADFQRLFWLSCFLNCAALAWLVWPSTAAPT